MTTNQTHHFRPGDRVRLRRHPDYWGFEDEDYAEIAERFVDCPGVVTGVAIEYDGQPAYVDVRMYNGGDTEELPAISVKLLEYVPISRGLRVLDPQIARIIDWLYLHELGGEPGCAFRVNGVTYYKEGVFVVTTLDPVVYFEVEPDVSGWVVTSDWMRTRVTVHAPWEGAKNTDAV